MERRSNSFDINDDLDGVDDFGNEPNPFEAANNQKIKDNSIPYDRIENDTDFDIEVPKVVAPKPVDDVSPPTYEQVRVDEQPNQGDLPPGFLNYYSKYFQLSDQVLKQRVFDAVRFTKPERPINDAETNSNDSTSQVDLYAAVWVTATVILVHFFAKNLFNLVLDDIIQGIKSNSDVDRKEVYSYLLHSIWLFFGYTFLVPFISFQVLKRDENTKFTSTIDLISVYGYSNINWVPVVFLQDILSRFGSSIYIMVIRWIVFAFGMLKSALYLFYATQDNSSPGLKLPLSIIIILVFHALFSFLMMFMLFY